MTDVIIPKMGMSTTEVDVAGWLVKLGDHVEAGAGLVEVNTEKVTVTIEAPSAGTVAEILVAEGQMANVGDVICRLS